MNQSKTPLYDTLVQFAQHKPVSFHVPGHKNGRFASKHASKHFNHLLEIDVTELSNLDDLHHPTECIKEAAELVADLYGVKKSFLLVNGSTVGNLAMILATCRSGDIILVQRNCHKSVINGIQLAGAVPVFLRTEVDEKAQVPVGVAYETLEAAIEAYPHAKALILTHPNYYGMTQNLQNMIDLAHKHHLVVLVDEAHGAHFCLGHPFPKSALAYGADIVVHSAHKTLPAMTMGSYLHINSSRVEEETVAEYLHMLQSSSPSYPIMASLDLARFELAQIKESNIEPLLAFYRVWKERLAGIPQIEILYPNDPLKVIIQTRCALSGFELQALFEEKGIYTELADVYNVLFILPLYIDETLEQVIDIIADALRAYPVMPINKLTANSEPLLQALEVPYGQLAQLLKRELPLEEALGYLAAEPIVPYPPGIPLLLKGERITQTHLRHIMHLKEAGATFQTDIEYIKVYDVKKGNRL
ncbi:aminotransferase class I/II-fold pyridoxal phosphate-dependent enzyme [Ectobacillus sp. JY-23]|uniref:aminotransferase class I/II-fold pyridoxal phosphate-dependent enzyme n=1 Tax=Ectobacillus sp. JY-23 TaxID=2933872 RepID=UPI001FF654E2|nr:aminotransferase class I/II-fold pyridoxal phosphate-dependent enzyme [Ectobacillus sp. JY-23]UOY91398.1 aminotransferase class I/II-fold pyridoxal phosphate-dependent enzyme [Ectobacillus sp. JY-23]